MPIEMDSRALIVFAFLIINAACQYDVIHLINSTQSLQDIERGGNGFYNNIYPQLNTSDHHESQQNSTIKIPIIRAKPTNTSQPNMNKYFNKTRSDMQSGICVKEVPTASLLKKNEVLVAGNGSDPSLSRIHVCCDGYQRNIHNFRKCDPICSNGCVNGVCVAPDTCNCYPDHIRNYGGFCIPTCPIGCGNGICNYDNTCICKEGYTLEPNGKFCAPKCSFGCANGNCTEPEICSCNNGYAFTNGKCEPICSKGCVNGDCIAPERCQCRNGYSFLNGFCQPICSRGCENGICVAPERCECSGHGWTLDQTGTRCTASCDKPCLNGVCSGPNQCTCRNGYISDISDSFRCVPTCNPPCENAICSGPNMCLCYTGYVKDRSVKGGTRCVKLS